ncbi:MAG: hypothetical protein HC892_02175 [Saprospiraceae bacterium]|nr:hypothetical protein [Saprospiraceae bacterium]
MAYQQPKRIILGFSPHHFSDFNDVKFKQPKLAKALFQRVYPIMSIQDFQPFETNQQELWWTYFQRWCVIPKARHYDYIGHYEARPKQLNLSNPKIAVERHFYRGTEPAGVSLQMIHYLEKIVQLTATKRIELILVSLPVHEAYRKAIPPHFNAIFEEKKQELKQRKIMVLDFSDYLLKDDYFSDHDHLNQEGASFFTTLLSQNLH